MLSRGSPAGRVLVFTMERRSVGHGLGKDGRRVSRLMTALVVYASTEIVLIQALD